MSRFAFGENWIRYSEEDLTPARIERARADFLSLVTGLDDRAQEELDGRSFLDVGFGQGLTLSLAAEAGAEVTGVDIDEDCLLALERTSAAVGQPSPGEVHIGSILDPQLVASLRSQRPEGWSVVHSWGVLHHTGSMWRALETCSELVAEDGLLVVALYNRHWSSPVWLRIKRLHARSGVLVRRCLEYGFVPILWLAKAVVTRRNPLHKERGMAFWRDVVDWVGGYPYEWASADEVVARASALGFELCRLRPAAVPTGCNEFVFRRATS